MAKKEAVETPVTNGVKNTIVQDELPILQVKLTRDIALGNGTRSAGEILGLVQCSKGVELTELLTALRNAHLCEIGDRVV